MHKHEHCCEHEHLAYCKVCRVVYCKDCNREWRDEPLHWWWHSGTPYTITYGSNTATYSAEGDADTIPLSATVRHTLCTEHTHD